MTPLVALDPPPVPLPAAASQSAKLGQVVQLFGDTVKALSADTPTLSLEEAAACLQTSDEDVRFIVDSGLLSSAGIGEARRVRVGDVVSLRLSEALRPPGTLDEVFDAARAEGLY